MSMQASRGSLQELCCSSTSTPTCLPYENNLNIYLCRGLRVPLKDLWAKIRNYS